MDNQLFVVCPFSRLEPFLQNKYGKNSFFLTYSGAVLQYQDVDYLLDVKDFIFREKIKTIFIVNDTSCRFLNGIVKQKKKLGFESEKIIEELYIDNYFSDFKEQTIDDQLFKLSELNIRNQINGIVNSTLLGSHIADLDIKVKGLITSKENKFYKEINTEKNTIYEL
jgi:carbonic anhydrase